MSRRSRAGLAAAVAAVTLVSVTACQPRPFTRDDVLDVPWSVVQTKERGDDRWQYVDADLELQQLADCGREQLVTRSVTCTAVDDDQVTLVYRSTRHNIRDFEIRVGDETVPLSCSNDGFWGDGLLFCLPTEASPSPTQWPPPRS